MVENKKIGLALSGGGAMGVAHIGVIEELEKSKIKIDCICGVSAGAIIGLVYAAGGLAAVRRFYDEINLKFFKKNKYLVSGGVGGALKYMEKVLGKLIGGKRFSDMEIPFSCCATNLATGQKEVFSSGDPLAAVMASAAYPGVFLAQNFGGKFYIDGGVTRNLPAEETRAMGADFVVGSSIYSIDEINGARAGKMNRFEVAARALNIFERDLAAFEERQCDFCFKPRGGRFHWFDFLKMDEIADAGRKNASKQIKDLLILINND